jgi:AraC-like DNA-binding protein
MCRPDAQRGTAERGAPPRVNLLAQGDGWRVSEAICHAGPGDRPFEERHDDVAIAAVVEGSFQYRSRAGRALLYPGALLLGNAGTCFQCGHEHGVGDRCLAFHYAPAFFAEIAASAAGSARFAFPAAMLPAGRRFAGVVVEAESRARGGAPLATELGMEELAIGLAENVLATVADGERTQSPSATDERRISDVLRYLEARCAEPLTLATLAHIARMSKYHFLRTFRRIVGVTPYQHLLGLRLRRAALGLRTTDAPVSAIAFDAGFGDLSTFNGAFRAMFGAAPTVFRRQGGFTPRPPRGTARGGNIVASS